MISWISDFSKNIFALKFTALVDKSGLKAIRPLLSTKAVNLRAKMFLKKSEIQETINRFSADFGWVFDKL